MLASRTLLFAATALGLSAASTAHAQEPWNDGSPSRLPHECIIGTLVDQIEDLNWTWVGFQGLPLVGQTYYMRVTVGSLGCSGEWVRPEVKLPKATKLAITSINPVYCFYQAPGASSAVQLTDGSCPSAPDYGVYPTGSSWPNPAGSSYPDNFWAFGPTVSPGAWPLAPGATLTIYFPVISDQPLSGFATDDYLLGATQVIDGNPGGSAPWDGHPSGYNGHGIPASGAWQGVFVTSSAYTGPRIVYPEPSFGNQTQTTIRTYAYVYNAACVNPNEVAVSMWLSDGVTDPPGGSLAGGACTLLTDGSGGSSCYFDWAGLQPETVYSWKASFLPQDVTGCGTIIQDDTLKFAKTAPVPGATHYALLAQPDGDGTIELSPADGTYVAGTQVTATAHGKLDHWTLDGADAGTTSPLVVTMNQSHTLVAIFAASSGGGGGKGGLFGCDVGGFGGSGAAGALATMLFALVARRRRS